MGAILFQQQKGIYAMEVAKRNRARVIREQEQTLDNSESVAFLGCVVMYCERHLDEIQGPVQMKDGSKKDLTGRELIAHLSAKYPALFRECRKQRALKHDLYITRPKVYCCRVDQL
jgi:hypothetical protein